MISRTVPRKFGKTLTGRKRRIGPAGAGTAQAARIAVKSPKWAFSRAGDAVPAAKKL
jgi:hypothetical protein